MFLRTFKILLILLLLLITAEGILQIIGLIYRTDDPISKILSKQNSASDGIKLLFFGDCLTKEYSKNNDGYPEKLESLINRNTNIKVSIANAAVRGERISPMLGRIKKILPVYRPDVTIIMVGGSESFYIPEDDVLIPSFLNKSKLFKFLKLIFERFIVSNRMEKIRNKNRGEIVLEVIEDENSPRTNIFEPERFARENEGWRILNDDDLGGAMKYFVENPDKKYSLIGRIAALIDLGRFEKAKEVIRDNKSTDEKYDVLQLALANIHLSQDKTLKALEVISDLYRRLPNDNSVLKTIAEIYLKRKSFDLAERFIEKAIKNESSDGEAYSIYAEILSNKKERNKAITVLKRGLKEDPDFYENIKNLVYIYLEKDDKINAKKELEKYLNLVPDDTEAIELMIGLRSEDMGKNPEDQAELISLKEQYYRKRPDAPNPYQALDDIVRICKKYGSDIIFQNYPHGDTPIIREYCKENDLMFIDNLDFFTKQGIYLEMTPTGFNNKELTIDDINKNIAQNILDFLIKKGFLK